MKWLAIDVGGANLKLADGLGFARSIVFPLWKQHKQLAQRLRIALAEAPVSDHLAVTMTGELADCYESRRQGVASILEAVAEAASGRHTRVYLVDGRLVTPQVALQRPLLAAASNWHALASFACRYVKREPAVLIDIGSTTCDIIPLVDGKPAARGTTDIERLKHQELVYTGVERSPVCAITPRLPYRGHEYTIAMELFATALDAYLILGDAPEDPHDDNTADGRPATRLAARARLARLFCADADQFSQDDARIVAEAIVNAQTSRIADALQKVIASMREAPTTVVMAGQGETLVRRVLATLEKPLKTVSLAQLAGRVVSQCGPAHSLAVLAREASGA
ncbi:MAG: hydantoinase/oxoprolinase family protein [Pirellulales bacterium]